MRQTRPYRHEHKNSNDTVRVLLFYVLPFIIFNTILFLLVTSRPRFEISVGETTDYQSTVVTITQKSLIPVTEMVTSMDGEVLELQKVGSRQYAASIHKNGALEVTMKGMNGMTRTTFEHISILDDAPPAVSDSSIDQGILTVTFEDSQAGLDYQSIYAVDSMNQQIYPISVDKVTNSATFAMDSNGLVVHATDLSGNEMQATFKSHKEGDKEVLTDDTMEDHEESEANTEASSAGGESAESSAGESSN
ncbi:hypothetical protein [Clostridium sp. AM58-1XD]|uniref:hypothetical protein n=1 Tax=Clostridium sp. AM58-1XD TaxID=2292307 RepID=UPI000E52C568|nr:hypothetical protein [Clostridium sp. AM58-1XD]RGY96294.1 hypothetical protein DXA13_17580 [Clostridium sp. AM58-1XD]